MQGGWMKRMYWVKCGAWITGDETLAPVLRNIAGQFSMRWEVAKQNGRPEDVIDWYDWMEEIRLLAQ